MCFEGCQLDVLIAAGSLQGSVLVMTDADGAGDVKDRRGYSQRAVCGSRYDGNVVSSVRFVQEAEHDLFELWIIRADGSGGWRM